MSGRWRSGVPGRRARCAWPRGGRSARPRGWSRRPAGSWLDAGGVGPMAAGGLIGARESPSALRTRSGVTGSPSTEESATTRVIAPSSRRTLPAASAAISRRSRRARGRSIAASPPCARAGWSGSAGRAGRARRRGPTGSGRAVARRAGERLRRAVAGEDDLLAGRVQGVEGVDELLLGVLLALERLDVVDQQGVEPAVALLEPFGPVLAQRGHELGREPLRGRVVEAEIRPVAAQVVDDRAEQVGLPEPGRPWRNRGLYASPGSSATASAAAWARRLPSPITKRSKVCRGSRAGISTAVLHSPGRSPPGSMPLRHHDALRGHSLGSRRAALERARVAPLDPGADRLAARATQRVVLLDRRSAAGERSRARRSRREGRPGAPSVTRSPDRGRARRGGSARHGGRS